jgi:hypothetical protein
VKPLANVIRRSAVALSAAIVLVVLATPVSADDQQNAEKQFKKVTAMTADFTGRRAVNKAMAEFLNLKRADLVVQRRDTGLNYGHIFLANQLVTAGLTMNDIAAQLKSGKTVFQIANEHNANWKQIASDAKKMNGRIDDGLFKRFLNPKSVEQDTTDQYDPAFDGVTADGDSTKDSLEEAQDRFLMWQKRAQDQQQRGGALGIADEKAAGYDHVKNGGPTGRTDSGPPANPTKPN